MPWHYEPMKDVANDEMLRGAVSKLRSGGIRMGEPTYGNAYVSYGEYIVIGRKTRGTETSKYPEEEKENSIP